MNENDYTWEVVYRYWQNDLEDLGTSLKQLLLFEVVRVREGWHGHDVDWIPKIWKDEYISKVKVKGDIGNECPPYYAPYWQTMKGTLHTAELLYQYRDDIEKEAAILIMASINEKHKKWPEEWDNLHRPMMEVYRTIWNTFPEIELWHHASREAMPITIDYYYPLGKLRPEDLYTLIKLFAVEANLSLNNWQLIKYVAPEDYIREAESIISRAGRCGHRYGVQPG